MRIKSSESLDCFPSPVFLLGDGKQPDLLLQCAKQYACQIGKRCTVRRANWVLPDTVTAASAELQRIVIIIIFKLVTCFSYIHNTSKVRLLLIGQRSDLVLQMP